MPILVSFTDGTSDLYDATHTYIDEEKNLLKLKKEANDSKGGVLGKIFESEHVATINMDNMKSYEFVGGKNGR